MDVFSFEGVDQETHTLFYPTIPAYEHHPSFTSGLSNKLSLQPLTPQVYVRDPPTERRPGTVAYPPLTTDRVPGQTVSAQSHSRFKQGPLPSHQPFSQESFPRRSKLTAHREHEIMAKKRRSLQAILIPSFLQSPLTSPTSTFAPSLTRSRANSSADPSSESTSAQSTFAVNSPRDSPPPSYLLDDDPFAKLGAAPSEVVQRIVSAQTLSSPPSTPCKPHSPLKPINSDGLPSSAPSSPPPLKGSFHSRPASKSVSFGRVQPIPASQKLAFAPKPSLPSLDTLSRMNIVLTKRARKGRVGATLPFEPWDSIDHTTSSTTTRSSKLPPRPSTSPSPSGAFIPTFSLASIPFAPFEHETDGKIYNPPTVPEETVVSVPVDGFNASWVVESEFFPDDTTSPIDQPIHDTDIIPTNLVEQSNQPLSLSGVGSDSELPYTIDVEGTGNASKTSIHLAPSVPLDNSFSSLSRSASISSSESDTHSFGAATSLYGNDDLAPTSSAESEFDFLNSPPEDFFSFPTSTTISTWQSDTSCGINTTPSSSVSSDLLHEPVDLMYQPGSSVGTVRPAKHYIMDQLMGGGELNDGADYEGYRGGSNSNHSYNQSNTDTFNNYSERGAFRRPSGGSANGRGGDDDDRGNRRPSRPSALSAASSSEVTSEEDEESAEPRMTGKAKLAEEGVSPSDDDIPLARRIPTALIAQKSIRRQVREERDQRRKERSEQATHKEARNRQATLRPAGASNPLPPGLLSSSQEAALHATKITMRPRTQTLPGRTTPPLSADDLMRKLQDVQVSSSRDPRIPSNIPSRSSGDAGVRGAFGKTDNEHSTTPESSRSLRPSRSFHRPQGRGGGDHRSVPLPASVDQKLVRARSRSRAHEEKPSFEDASRVPVPRISEEHRRMVRSSGQSRSARPSIDSDGRSNLSTGDLPPIPPLPPIEAPARYVTQQRIFVGDMQRYNVVEIDDTTSAGEVIGMLDQQGSLKGWIGTGEWMVWEVAHDFGMERPVRNFERLSDVQASWNKDKLVSTFMVRLTPLAPLLSRSAIPSSSPTYAGYVEWESKRGKWSKRWMQLREHSLWISKRDSGKDQTLLCALSNFDAYHINRLYKAPKPFVFAIKSTDKLSFFENASDYLHVISCSETEGKTWMEKILVARSYVLHQERNVLFNPKSYGGQPTVGTPVALSRAATHKRPAQPLVSVANHDVFEPGSLLHRQG